MKWRVGSQTTAIDRAQEYLFEPGGKGGFAE